MLLPQRRRSEGLASRWMQHFLRWTWFVEVGDEEGAPQRTVLPLSMYWVSVEPFSHQMANSVEFHPREAPTAPG